MATVHYTNDTKTSEVRNANNPIPRRPAMEISFDDDLLYERAVYRSKHSAVRDISHQMKAPYACVDQDLMYERELYQRKHHARVAARGGIASSASSINEYVAIDEMIDQGSGSWMSSGSDSGDSIRSRASSYLVILEAIRGEGSQDFRNESIRERLSRPVKAVQAYLGKKQRRDSVHGRPCRQLPVLEY